LQFHNKRSIEKKAYPSSFFPNLEAAMNTTNKTRWFLVVSVLLITSLLFSPYTGKAINVHASPEAGGTVGKTLYLPFISRNYPIETVYGAGMDKITPAWGLDLMVAAKTGWTRTPGIVWADIEPTEGNYNWSVLSEVETELRTASANGLQVIMIVHGTPQWARRISGSGTTCGPIALNKMTAFGNFMRALVARYSKAPYNIKYWELWNEEDADWNLFVGDSGYGCWGDKNDPYFGGGYYANMLKAAYPQIKSADPDSKVLVGGLLLDCDPRDDCTAMGKNKNLGLFLEGILKNGGGSYFDGVSFHAYDYYGGTLGVYGNANWGSGFNTTGPVAIVKTQYIRNLLASYGVTGKFLMNTESAIICGSTGTEPICKTSDFTKTKVYYIAQAYATAIAWDLKANIWYSVLGWRASALLGTNLLPTNSYTSYLVSRNELANSKSVREIVDFPGVKGYEFFRGDIHVWVLWSLDGSPQTIDLWKAPSAAYDTLGKPIAVGTSMDVPMNPIYLEWKP
jgi:hypothetical protein